MKKLDGKEIGMLRSGKRNVVYRMYTTETGKTRVGDEIVFRETNNPENTVTKKVAAICLGSPYLVFRLTENMGTGFKDSIEFTRAARGYFGDKITKMTMIGVII